MGKKRSRIGIIGDTGIVGREIERILNVHDRVTLTGRVNSERHEGDLKHCDILFLATEPYLSLRFAAEFINSKRIIDMSGAFRLDKEKFEKWYHCEHTAPDLLDIAVYGLPAFYPKKIREARLIANPGCYATAALLALKPLQKLIAGPVSLSGLSGISGSGERARPVANERTYAHGRTHKHVPEIERYSRVKITHFTPVVIENVFRGLTMIIHATLKESASVRDICHALNKKYSNIDCVQALSFQAEKGTETVRGTHNTLIQVGIDGKALTLCSMLDNLAKGAASQAVENMNLMLGYHRLQGISRAY